mgnify:CR=1 FL=1
MTPERQTWLNGLKEGDKIIGSEALMIYNAINN